MTPTRAATAPAGWTSAATLEGRGNAAGDGCQPLVVYEAALELASTGARPSRHSLRWADDGLADVPLERWLAPPAAYELALLATLQGPVLDIGCGPGRHTAALVQRGTRAVGIDVSPVALHLARRRGAPVLEGSIFDHPLGSARWGSVLLLDGNLGIGGHPLALLGRVRSLLRPGGRAVVELDPRTSGVRRSQARLEHAGRSSGPFAWAYVGTDAIAELAHRAGLECSPSTTVDGRAFAFLRRPSLPTEPTLPMEHRS